MLLSRRVKVASVWLIGRHPSALGALRRAVTDREADRKTDLQMNRETEVQTGRVLRLPHKDERRRQISAIQRADWTLLAIVLANGVTGLQSMSQRASRGSGQTFSYVDPEKRKQETWDDADDTVATSSRPVSVWISWFKECEFDCSRFVCHVVFSCPQELGESPTGPIGHRSWDFLAFAVDTA